MMKNVSDSNISSTAVNMNQYNPKPAPVSANQEKRKIINFVSSYSFKPVKAITESKSSIAWKHIDFSPTVSRQPKNKLQSKNEYFFSDYILPCFIVLTQKSSIHKISSILDNIDGDPLPQLQQLLPSLSTAIRSSFPNSKMPPGNFIHDQLYFNFAYSLASVSDENVISLTAVLCYSLKSRFTKPKIVNLCTKFLSHKKESMTYFMKFLNEFMRNAPVKKATNYDFNSIPDTLTRKELISSVFSNITHELEPLVIAPEEVTLPPFTPRLIPDNTNYITKSYVKLGTPLQKNISDALLFNTQYVSLPSGSEGGSTGQAFDDQYLNDKELYFWATSYIPDAEVRVYRLEKAINLIENGSVYDTYKYPGFLVNSIKDVYGKHAQRVFDAMSVNYEKVCECILPTLKMAKNRYYELSKKWEQYHSYENCVFGREMYLKVPNPDLSLPAVINRTPEWEYIKEMFSVISQIKNEGGTSVIDELFRILETIKEPSYFPRIVISAIQLIPSILEALQQFEEFIDRDVNEDIRYEVKMQLCVIETGLKSALITDDSIEDDFYLSDAPRAMKLVVQHYSAMNVSKPGRTYWDAIFGGIEGHTLTKRINAFLAIMEACDVRDEFWPLVDLFDDVQKRKIKISQYPIVARKICPFRDLYEISQNGTKITCTNIEEQSVQVVLPILFTPPADLSKNPVKQ